MSKTRKFEKNVHPVEGYLRNLKYKDLKKECVLRGMPFELVVNSGIPEMSSYLMHHFGDDIKPELLDMFDNWQEDQIKDAMVAKGQDPKSVLHPSLRLGYIAERDDDGNTTKQKRVKVMIKKKRSKRERTGDNIFKGTKKAYTFELQGKGLKKAEVIKMVMDKFPDAQEKSIGIWYNKAGKLRSNGCSPINAKK